MTTDPSLKTWEFPTELLTGNVNLLVEWLSLQQNSKPRNFENHVSRILNHCLDLNNREATERVMKIANIDPLNAIRKDFGILAIRYLLMVDRDDEALTVFENLLKLGESRKRQIELIIEKIARKNMLKASVLYLTHLLPNFVAETANVSMFLSEKNTDICSFRHKIRK